jgi:glucans biosynthesis protein
MQRRQLMKVSAAMAASLALAAGRARAAGGLPRGPASQPFSYAALKGQARALASDVYRPPTGRIPAPVAAMEWEQYQSIHYRPERALWIKEKVRFRASLFHLGGFYRAPVHIFEVVDGRSTAIPYDPTTFDFGKSGLDTARLPKDMGFAGFRLMYHTDWSRDVVAFLGASYFRAVGSSLQYGQSARGLAIDCGMDRAEEFPLFTAFWLERPDHESGRVTVYALLDSPSVAGAYRFDIVPSDTLTMDVDAALYPRRPIERVGIAPLTSMFLCGENDHRVRSDWRPEVHDVDGLAMWTGAGEWIWRPLSNPAELRVNSFVDENPRGFGLFQRDRNFDHYQDDIVFYERRPSVWVEPKGVWGKGAVMLVELPADDETGDNIVAFWNPAARPQRGQELLLAYRLHWGERLPAGSPLARVTATRTGLGGAPGQKRSYFSWRFVVDFAGGSLGLIARNATVEPIINVSRGVIESASARTLESINGYRAIFDLRPDVLGGAPIDLRLYLRADGEPLTETWIYQWTPPLRP